MSFTNWIKSCFSPSGKALTLYRRGMEKANKRDHAGAVADYSAALQLSQITADLQAMVLYNRALAYSAMGEDAKAAQDLTAALQIPDVPEHVKTTIQQRRERIRRRGVSKETAE